MSCKCFDQKPQCRPTDEFRVRLEASKCHCESRFSVKERKSSFIVVCHETDIIDKYKIDGHFDTDTTHDKCDYLFHHHPVNPQKNTCLFVELKGTDIEHAVKQIGDTIDRFSSEGYFHDKPNLNIIGAIVSTGYPSNNSTYRRRVGEVSKRFKRYNLQIVNKKYEMRYYPETGNCLGKGEK
jgi:hypothetical protein